MQGFGKFNFHFLPVADAPLSKPKTPPSRVAGKTVKLTNPGFESGIKGWILSYGLEKSTSRENNILKPYQGENMFGWMRLAKGKKNHELYRKDYAVQKVSVKEGNWYELSARAITAEPDWPKEKWISETWTYPFFQSRCRNRISLVVDPKGDEDFSGSNSTQWFSTDGKWMLLKKAFQAKARTVTIGATFYQRGERDWDAAFVDDFELVEFTGNTPMP
jgi:hypothetical protein